MTHDLPLELLACPSCKSALIADPDALTCTKCGARYDTAGGVPNLIPADVHAKVKDMGDPSWDRWREAMRGLEDWRARREARATGATLPPDGSSDVLKRELFQHIKVRGTVVDVGSKDGATSRLLGPDVNYIGIDPLVPHAPAGLRKGAVVVRGVAEALPLRDRSIDAVLSLAALDYYRDGEAALDEMLRVLKPGCSMGIMVSVVTATVAHARGGRTKAARLSSAISAIREVGFTTGAGLVGAVLLEKDRPHTHYYRRTEVLGMIGDRAEIDWSHEVKQPGSTILYIAARKRKNTRLKVI